MGERRLSAIAAAVAMLALTGGSDARAGGLGPPAATLWFDNASRSGELIASCWVTQTGDEAVTGCADGPWRFPDPLSGPVDLDPSIVLSTEREPDHAFLGAWALAPMGSPIGPAEEVSYRLERVPQGWALVFSLETMCRDYLLAATIRWDVQDGTGGGATWTFAARGGTTLLGQKVCR